jgi:hypothetical protein
MKLYMFRTVRLSIISSLFTVHSAMVYVIQVCRQHSNRTIQLSTNVYDTPLLSVQWIKSWWWTEELSETCRVSWQNKFVNLVHLVLFIQRKLLLFSFQPKFCCLCPIYPTYIRCDVIWNSDFLLSDQLRNNKNMKTESWLLFVNRPANTTQQFQLKIDSITSTVS